MTLPDNLRFIAPWIGCFALLLAPSSFVKDGVTAPSCQDVSNNLPLMTRTGIESQIRTRAARCLAEQQLVVDYYRIGRRLTFPLPVERVVHPGLLVPGIPDYPWEIWLSWEIEERLNSLGWAAEWFNDQQARTAASRELEALARWPEFTPNRRLDLCLGHTARTLWQAYTQWNWLEPSVRDSIGKGLDQLIRQAAPWIENQYGGVRSAREILSAPEPHGKVHNIPFIGLIGVSLAANARHNDAEASLNRRVRTLLEVLMDLRQRGYTEGVAYDGYLLDFMVCWLQTLVPSAQKQILDQFDFGGFLNESCMLGAPGDLVQVAEIGDVEPGHMSFHISAQARFQQSQPNPVRGWYLSRCRPDVLRADALACLRSPRANWQQTVSAPGCGLQNAHYARVLRSGWEPEDLAVAVATSNSPAGHIHFDYGSMTIGTSGRWMIADPGYQQYMPGEEREFTLGPLAHNAPVLNGRSQEIKLGRTISGEQDGKGVCWLKADMTRCYPTELGARKVFRTVWLLKDRLVVLADEIEGSKIETLSYHWHGCPEAAWRVQNGWAMLYTNPGTMLWFTSPTFSISDTQLERLAGSRGQLTLSTQGKVAPVVWWIFSRSEIPPSVEVDPGGRWIQTMGQRFKVE
jgi:hypothetical protein